MISFRYHVFTIVSIFLAVALGIAIGNAYVQPKLVNTLRDQTEGLRTNLHEVQGRVGELETEVGRLRRSGDILDSLDGGELAGVPVIVVTEDGVDPDALSQTRDALAQAQARLLAVLSVTGRVAATDDHDRTELAEVLGLAPSATAAAVVDRMAEALADRLATGPPRRGAQPGGGDLLDELLRGQFVRFPGGFPDVSEGDLSELGGHGEVIVAVTGGEGDLVLAPDTFMVPFVRDAIDGGATIAAGEPSSTAEAFVEALRGDDSLDGGSLVTVDDLNYPIGGVALVLGLERVITVGQGGDYGIKEGAEARIPPLR